jgi:transcriptional regulator with XRE-family HTH domain
MVGSTHPPITSMRRMKVERLLLENLRALMAARGVDGKALAFAVGHSQAWLSKILTGDRKMSLPDLDRIADYFGLTASQILQHGIGPLTERRRRERRAGMDRRLGDRRGQGRPFLPKGVPMRDPEDEGVA